MAPVVLRLQVHDAGDVLAEIGLAGHGCCGRTDARCKGGAAAKVCLGSRLKDREIKMKQGDADGNGEAMR